MDQDWQEIKRLFREALSLPPDERDAYLDRESPDSTFAEQVRQLLSNHHTEDNFLQTPVGAGSGQSISIRPPNSPDRWHDPLIGKIIDQFQITERVALGGMGVVYAAQQLSPARQVAFKILRPDLEFDESRLTRFMQESETLAQLNHENIASVYASGVLTGDGGHPQPWFAMEWISGTTLDKYASQRRLPLTEQVDLLRRICEAVGYAHQQGIIHRDLKPTNIMIESDSGQVKLVDFGIARMTNLGEADLTQTFDLLGTIDYLAPELLARGAAEATESSDVFALGVIGFELFSGSKPRNREGQSLLETIQGFEKHSPRSLGESMPDCPRDIRWIIDKCLHPDPRHRIATASELAAELERWQQQRPILSRPPSALNRLLRFSQRNWQLVSASAAIALLMIGAISWITWEAGRARRSEQAFKYEAEKGAIVSSFVTNEIVSQLLRSNLDDSDSENQLAQLESSVANQIESRFANRPKIQAALQNELGTVLYNAHDFRSAATHYQTALTIWERELGANHEDTLKALNNLALAEIATGASDTAESLARQAYQRRLDTLGLDDSATLTSLNNLADLLRRRDQLAESEALFTRGLDVLARTDADPKLELTLKANLASLYLQTDQIENAIRVHRDANRTAERAFGTSHELFVQTSIRLATSLDKAGQTAAAIDVLQRVLDRSQDVLKSKIDLEIWVRRLSARIYRHQEDFKAARQQLLIANQRAEDSAPDHPAISKIARDLKRVERESAALKRKPPESD